MCTWRFILERFEIATLKPKTDQVQRHRRITHAGHENKIQDDINQIMKTMVYHTERIAVPVKAAASSREAPTHTVPSGSRKQMSNRANKI